MLYAGFDLSRKRVDFCLLDQEGLEIEAGAAPPDVDGLDGLARRLRRHQQPITGAIESMTGARFVHDHLEQAGFEIEIADAEKVKGLAPLACKTDRIDAWVLAELARRELVPAIWLPDPEVRAERERARFRLYLVRKRTSLKNRVHATLMTHGIPCPVSDLFGAGGRELLARLQLPEPWAGTVQASLALIDELEREIARSELELRRLGAHHRYVPLLTSVPGIAWVLAYTIAAEIGDIARFPSATKLTGYTGLCPRVYQSGESDRRGPLSKRGPRYLRWALIEATSHASRHPLYRTRYQRTKPDSAASADPGSPKSSSRARSRSPSGTCSPTTVPSLRQAPPRLWPPRRPAAELCPRSEHPINLLLPRGGDREMSAADMTPPARPP